MQYQNKRNKRRYKHEPKVFSSPSIRTEFVTITTTKIILTSSIAGIYHRPQEAHAQLSFIIVRRQSKMADSDDEGSINLTGFLFGNINERGELEDDDILDEVRKEPRRTNRAKITPLSDLQANKMSLLSTAHSNHACCSRYQDYFALFDYRINVLYLQSIRDLFDFPLGLDKFLMTWLVDRRSMFTKV